jgi:hypothetical protein
MGHHTIGRKVIAESQNDWLAYGRVEGRDLLCKQREVQQLPRVEDLPVPDISVARQTIVSASLDWYAAVWNPRNVSPRIRAPQESALGRGERCVVVCGRRLEVSLV